MGTVIELQFEDGPLGLGMGEPARTIVKVAPGGQAERGGVQAGDVLVAVAGADVQALDYDAVLQQIKSAARPLKLTFVRPTAAGSASSAEKAPQTSLGRPSLALPSKDEAKAAVQRASQLMKGFLATSVQIVNAFDEALNKGVQKVSNLLCVRESISKIPRQRRTSWAWRQLLLRVRLGWAVV
jgi:hypothetical protein